MFRINDIDVGGDENGKDNKVLALSKIIDKSPRSDKYLRERGVITYPTKYQIEKLSLTLGFNLQDQDHKVSFISLATELDEYPFVFISSEKVKSTMMKYYDRDTETVTDKPQVFMLEKVTTTLTQESKYFVVMNLVLYPVNMSTVVEDYSFITYQEDDSGKKSIIYGVDSPVDSKVYQDFFLDRIVKSRASSLEFFKDEKVLDLRILSPYFTENEPKEKEIDIDFETIAYTDISGTIQDVSQTTITNEHDDAAYESFYSYNSPGTEEDKLLRNMYVYWRGDLFNSDPLTSNAVQSIEVVRVNSIVLHPIIGQAYPFPQYMGKGAGYMSVSFISETGDGNTAFTPYSIFKTLLENYNMNLSKHPKFSAFNFFKIKSVLTSIVDVGGYVPAQVFLQETGEEKVHNYTAVFVESSASKIISEGFAIKESTKDNRAETDSVISPIRFANKYLLDNALIKKALTTTSIDNLLAQRSLFNGGDIFNDYIISNDKSSKMSTFIKGFFSRIMRILKGVNDDVIYAKQGEKTPADFINNIEFYAKGARGLTNERKIGLQNLVTELGRYVSEAKLSSEVLPILSDKDKEDSVKSLNSEFYKFKHEALRDLNLAQSLGVSQETPYLNVSDPRDISAAPFLSWAPLFTKDRILEEYEETKRSLDEFFHSINEDNDIADAARDVAKKMGLDRGEVLNDWDSSIFSTDNADKGVAPIVTSLSAAEDVVDAVADFIGVGGARNVLDWIGEKDAGTTGAAALSTVFGINRKHGKDLTKMTIPQLLAFQDECKVKYEICRKFDSAAAGKYQGVRSTINECMKAGVIKSTDYWDEKTQNRFGLWAGTIKNNRAAKANDFILKRNLYNKNQVTKAEYTKAKNRYWDSISAEWCAITNSSGGLGGKCGGSPGAGASGAYEKIRAEMSNMLDRYPLFSAETYNNFPLKSKLAVPYELAGEANSQTVIDTGSTTTPAASPAAQTSSTVATGAQGATGPTGASGVTGGTPTNTGLSSAEQKFVEMYAGKIPLASGSTVSTPVTNPSLSSTPKPTEAVEFESEIGQTLKLMGTVTDYTVFDHDINMQIQARDGTKWFNEGFNLSFPTIRAYIVFGGSNDALNSYSIHKPNFIELHGLTAFNTVCNNRVNPIDVAYLEMVNPGRVYTDQALFWQSFKSKLDFGNYGTVDELHILISSMMIEVGNRLHIKAGYGNDPNKLETIFNGEIVGVDEASTLRIVAEGYGREMALVRRGRNDPLVLSSLSNSGTRQSIAHILIGFEEIQNFGRRECTFSDFLVKSYFKTVAMDPINMVLGGAFSAAADVSNSIALTDPEGRVTNSGIGSDDTWTALNFGSTAEENFLEAKRKSPLLRNVYAEEVTTVDQEFQWTFFSSANRENHNRIKMMDDNSWDIMQIMMHRHPNTLAKVMFYESEATMFYGIKDQCYLANDLGQGLQSAAARGESVELYEKLKYLRYKAVSQMHVVSSGVNLISNGMKVQSSFCTEIQVEISTAPNIAFGPDPDYWKNPETLVMRLDDNLRPSMIRSKTLKMNACHTRFGGLRYGTTELVNEAAYMYGGDITIIGDASYKNGDVVFINDMSRGILGFVDVDDCRHFFNEETGFITVFTPRLCTEAKKPYFSSLGKKVRVAFAGAVSPMVARIAQNIETSNLFLQLNAMVDQIGVTSTGGIYNWLPMMSTLHTLIKSNKADLTYRTLDVGINTAVLGFLGYATAKGVGAMYSGLVASTGYNAINAAAINTYRTAALGALRLASTELAVSLAGQGIMRTVGLFLGRTILSIGISLLANPLGALIAILATVGGYYFLSDIEEWLLKRDPINLFPVTIYGRPYMAGIVGANASTALIDSIVNLKTTMKSAFKVFNANYQMAKISNNKVGMSTFDYDYTE